MITRLYIKDFILIKELNLQLNNGFTSITGETGAGKSILVGAIGLILGNRADTKSVREGAKKAIIEADFDLKGLEAGLMPLFDMYDLDFEPICKLRREITTSGKSRAFVNDTPVTTTVMKAIGEHLADIHSQHHNMLIGDPLYQMSILDELADNLSIRMEYKALYEEYTALNQRLKEEIKRIEEQSKEQEFIAFQLEQLNQADLQSGELEQLEDRQVLAQHTTEIKDALLTVSSFSESADMDIPSLLSQLHTATRKLSQVASHYSQVDELHQRLQSLVLELTDIIRESDGMLDDIELDPSELERIEARIDTLQGLLFKFKVGDTDELIALRDKYGEMLEDITNADDYLKDLEAEVNAKLEKAKSVANKLTESRQKAAKELLPPLHLLMQKLGVAGATFKVDLQPLSTLTEQGVDGIQFLFATNKKTLLQPIREIASGGEISRFMLALKTILAEHSVLPTVIFDEIDTGVSGEVAEKLGEVMQQLGQSIQVLAITHLPQIAALSAHQLVVSKSEEIDGYFTSIKSVEGEERVHELANMLTGAKMTEAALANARALLSHNKS